MKKGQRYVALMVCSFVVAGCNNKPEATPEKALRLVSTTPHLTSTPFKLNEKLLGCWLQIEEGCTTDGKEGLAIETPVFWRFKGNELTWKNFTHTIKATEKNELDISGEPYRYKLLTRDTLLLCRINEASYLKLIRKAE